MPSPTCERLDTHGSDLARPECPDERPAGPPALVLASAHRWKPPDNPCHSGCSRGLRLVRARLVVLLLPTRRMLYGSVSHIGSAGYWVLQKAMPPLPRPSPPTPAWRRGNGRGPRPRRSDKAEEELCLARATDLAAVQGVAHALLLLLLLVVRLVATLGGKGYWVLRKGSMP